MECLIDLKGEKNKNLNREDVKALMCLSVGGIIFAKKKIWKALTQNLLILITFEKRESFELKREKVVWGIEQTKALNFRV